MKPRLPFLTADIPGIGGMIKARFEDFVVEEIPAYPAAGEGTHTYLYIEKLGLTTMQAARDLARGLGVAPREIGYAGLKDSRALTRQWFSVEHVPEDRIRALTLPKIKFLEVTRHTNKIKTGHLAGNRFVLRVRESKHDGAAAANAVMQVLATRGVPNYFGPQRFGGRGDNWILGRAIVRDDPKDALDQYLGRVTEEDTGVFGEARRAYDAGQFARARTLWPYLYRGEHRALTVLEKTPDNFKRAWYSVDLSLKRLFLSAYQSQMFNQVLAGRIAEIDRIKVGDLAFKHNSGAVFRVEDAATEQPRCDAFEISPTGPLFGYRTTMPTGEPGEVEQKLLDAEGLTPERFKAIEAFRVKGGRRALRFRPHDWSVKPGMDGDGAYLEFRFTLPKGCYATALLREVLKSDAKIGEQETEEDE